MTASSLVTEPTSRRVSPAFLVLAVMCFFFAFAGVSCNTDVAKQTLNRGAALGGQAQSAQLNSCLDALRSVDLFSYTGLNFVVGSSPSALGTTPGRCRAGQSTLSPGGATPSAGDANIGVQPFALAAFIAIALGIGIGIAGIFRRIRASLQFMTVSALTLLAFLLLVLNQAHVQTSILDRIDSLATGNGAPFSVAAYFTVSAGAAYFLALAALGITALYNVSALFIRPAPHTADTQPRAPD